MARTKKETSEVIAKVIKTIRRHANITNKLIQQECAKNDISEKAVTTIAKGTGKKILPFNKADWDD